MSSSVSSVLFLDFDGTLVESQKAIYHAVCHVFREEHIQPPSFEEYYIELRHPFIDFYRSRGIKAPEKDIYKVFEYFMAIHWYDLFPDVVPFLQSAHFRSYIIVAISGNVSGIIERVFQEYLIHPYFRSVFEKAYNKEDAFRKVIFDMNIAPEQVVAIGDSISDIEGARASGITRAYGILRGPARTFRIQQAMKSAGARAVISSLNEVWFHEYGFVGAR